MASQTTTFRQKLIGYWQQFNTAQQALRVRYAAECALLDKALQVEIKKYNHSRRNLTQKLNREEHILVQKLHSDLSGVGVEERSETRKSLAELDEAIKRNRKT